jgi:ABC-type xylose transport system permease subunit
MANLKIGHIYVATIILAGAVIGIVEGLRPHWMKDIPALLILVGVSLIVEGFLWRKVMAGDAEPLDMNWRVGGFISGGILASFLPRLFGA